MPEKIVKAVWKTIDGTVFSNQKDAIQYEESFNDVMYFSYRYSPLSDLSVEPNTTGYIVVNALRNHRKFALHALHEIYGNPITFRQNKFDSTVIAQKWLLTGECEKSILRNVSYHNMICVEDAFAKRTIFGPGIKHKNRYILMS